MSKLIRSSAAKYVYCHSQVFLDNFPARPFYKETQREIVLLTFDRPMSSEDATAEVAKQGLERPYYDDALYFGIKYPEAQLEAPVAFLHDPWLGNHGRRDAIFLWSNEGGGNWVWKGLTTSGRNITGWHSCVQLAQIQDR